MTHLTRLRLSGSKGFLNLTDVHILYMHYQLFRPILTNMFDNNQTIQWWGNSQFRHMSKMVRNCYQLHAASRCSNIPSSGQTWTSTTLTYPPKLQKFTNMGTTLVFSALFRIDSHQIAGLAQVYQQASLCDQHSYMQQAYISYIYIRNLNSTCTKIMNTVFMF